MEDSVKTPLADAALADAALADAVLAVSPALEEMAVCLACRATVEAEVPCLLPFKLIA